MRAIKDTGGRLVAACDLNDSVGVIDGYGMGIDFVRTLDAAASVIVKRNVNAVVVCTPNWIHTQHAAWAMSHGCRVIVEKPIALGVGEIGTLRQTRDKTGCNCNTIAQLRLNPRLAAARGKGHWGRVNIVYHTPRGPWYDESWKGDVPKSGGVLFNIGIHLLDMAIWMFGPARESWLCGIGRRGAEGMLLCERADVSFDLSTSPKCRPQRSMTMDGHSLDISDGFTDAHTEAYRRINAGEGVTIEDASPAIELAEKLTKQGVWNE
jgi:UDP-N-acetyl-2-amino-2-deoxyglucuronate dehydrogenase